FIVLLSEYSSFYFYKKQGRNKNELSLPAYTFYFFPIATRQISGPFSMYSHVNVPLRSIINWYKEALDHDHWKALNIVQDVTDRMFQVFLDVLFSALYQEHYFLSYILYLSFQ